MFWLAYIYVLFFYLLLFIKTRNKENRITPSSTVFDKFGFWFQFFWPQIVLLIISALVNLFYAQIIDFVSFKITVGLAISLFIIQAIDALIYNYRNDQMEYHEIEENFFDRYKNDMMAEGKKWNDYFNYEKWSFNNSQFFKDWFKEYNSQIDSEKVKLFKTKIRFFEFVRFAFFRRIGIYLFFLIEVAIMFESIVQYSLNKVNLWLFIFIYFVLWFGTIPVGLELGIVRGHDDLDDSSGSGGFLNDRGYEMGE